jgi:hypothetical protein
VRWQPRPSDARTRLLADALTTSSRAPSVVMIVTTGTSSIAAESWGELCESLAATSLRPQGCRRVAAISELRCSKLASVLHGDKPTSYRDFHDREAGTGSLIAQRLARFARAAKGAIHRVKPRRPNPRAAVLFTP